MRVLSIAKIAAALAVVATFLAACVVDEGPGPRPMPPRGGGMCTNEYQPVCAQRGDERRTFGNACVARSEGFRIIDQGECRRGGGGGGNWGGGGGGGAWGPPPQRACTMEYRPVCGERRGQRQTFSNSCMAEAEGFHVVDQGECRRGGGNWNGGGGNRPPQRACTREYAPVCARQGRTVRTFGNACEAQSADFQIIRQGAC